MKYVARHRAPRRPRATAAPARWVAGLAAAALAVTLLVVAGPAAVARSNAPTVTGLSVTSGGTWGSDLVTVRGTGFAAGVASLRFGSHRSGGFWVLNDTTLQAYSPEVRNKRQRVDVRVMLRTGAISPSTPADVFTFVVPTRYTALNGHWSAATSRVVARSMVGRARALNARPVAHNPGHWTPAMGRSAVRRAAAWLGMPYTWAGGTVSGPSYGSCYGDGLIGKFDCTFQGFDCSGLTLYAWGKYEHLAHFAATQSRRAGRFHPTVAELQPGDLMFFSEGGPISHVVMYAGQGRIIQASWSGWPIRYNTVAEVLSTHSRYFGATRPMSRGRQGSAPTVRSVSVTSSTIGGGATVTIRGSHLDTTSRVDFGGTGSYRFSIRNSTTVTAVVPAHAAGTVHVRLSNAWGRSAATDHAVIRYTAPATTSARP